MPAQNIHILNNFNENAKKISPWYRLNDDFDIITPEWKFNKEEVHRF